MFYVFNLLHCQYKYKVMLHNPVFFDVQTHPDASSFRTKGLANYDLLSQLFQHNMTKGVYHHSSKATPPNTDDERELEEEMLGMGVSDISGSMQPQQPASMGDGATSPPRLQNCICKRGSESTSSMQRTKCFKGKASSNAKDTAWIKFVEIADRQNAIMEDWLSTQKQHLVASAPTSAFNVGFLDDPYSHCVNILKDMQCESEEHVFLKGCKELQNEYDQKAFLLMTKN